MESAINTDDLGPELRGKLENLPKAPGCYIFRDAENVVLYVGKAVNLRSRVRSYFNQADDGRLLYPVLRKHIADLETVVTDTEQEALVLENNLIKKFKPRYNIRLRDDKTYVSVKVSTRDEWPRTYIVRRYKKDGNQYFGPFPSAHTIRQTLDSLRPIFPLRLCSDHTLYNRSRPCIYYDIGKCCAPCVGKVDADTYADYVTGLVQFLKGRDRGIIDDMRAKMDAAAEELDFELAATLRDRIAMLEQVIESQKTQTNDFADRDVIGCFRAGEELQVHVLFFREGKLINSASHLFKNPLPDADVLRQFVIQYYANGTRHVPREIVTALELDDADELAHYLAKRAMHAVDVKSAVRGQLKDLIELANTNAKYAHKDLLALEQREETLLAVLQQKLGLRNFPERIECFDISTLQGTNTVASQVTFVHGRPEKADYKRYRIAPENAGNDFDAMAEVISRRIRRSTDENDPLPDLLVLDGGVPQLSRVLEIFDAAGIIDCDLVALAKSRRQARRGGVGRSPERIFKPGLEKPIVLEPDASETYLMQRIRDEAHRFAITYHRKRRRIAAMQSGLESIAGLGPKRRHALLDHFGTTAAVRTATADEIAKVPGISRNLAETIHQHFIKFVDAGAPDGDETTDETGDETGDEFADDIADSE